MSAHERIHRSVREPDARSADAQTAQPADAQRPVRRAQAALVALPGLAHPSDPLGGTAASPEVASALQRRRGRGEPLPPEVAQRFEAQLNTDLSGVRVHADAEADGLARSVQATAFSQGSDIYFRRGTYAPGSTSGQHLLAHELVHVTQQASSISGGPVIGRADDPAEVEADRIARDVTGRLHRAIAVPGRAWPSHQPGEPPDGKVRRFIDASDFKALNVVGAQSRLQALYPKFAKLFTWAVVRGYVESDAAVSLTRIETDLGITRPDSSALTTPMSPSPSSLLASSPVVSSRRPLPTPPQLGPVAEKEGSPAEATSSPVISSGKGEKLDQPPQPSVGALLPATGPDLYAATLREWVQALYLINPAPTKAEFLKQIRLHYSEQEITTAKFVYALQDAVRATIGEHDFVAKTAIRDLVGEGTDVTKSAIYKKAWTLRHYTPSGTSRLHKDDLDQAPPFGEIKSTVSLNFKEAEPSSSGTDKKKKSGHTSDRDWNKYGNVGNTFYLLCIDGKLASDQAFLKDCKWYCDFDFAQIASMWLSSDWLAEDGIKGEAIRGSGERVKRELIKIVGSSYPSVPMFLTGLKDRFNNLEIKVPGGLPVTEWHGPVKYPFG
jgi:hypothetical protein